MESLIRAHSVRTTLVLALAACLVQVACGGGSTSATTGTTPPPPAAGTQLVVSPSTVSFGDVVVNSSRQQNGTLSAGSSSVTVSSASWSGAGFSLSGITFPLTISAGQSIPFTVAFDPKAGGNSSGEVSFTSDASSAPISESLSGTGIHQVSLSWSPSSSAIIGYNVYRSMQSGGPYTKLNASPQPATGYKDDAVQAGTTYYYVTTAVNSSSVESSRSNQVAAVIPVP